MAIERNNSPLFNADAFAAAAAPATNNGGTKNNKPKAQTWLNIGIEVPVTQPDGSTVMEFVGLPVGIPLDTAEPMALGNTVEWNQKVQVRNFLLSELQKLAAQQGPGEGMVLEGTPLKMQVYRNKPKEAPVAADNPYLAALNGMKLA